MCVGILSCLLEYRYLCGYIGIATGVNGFALRFHLIVISYLYHKYPQDQATRPSSYPTPLTIQMALALLTARRKGRASMKVHQKLCTKRPRASATMADLRCAM